MSFARTTVGFAVLLFILALIARLPFLPFSPLDQRELTVTKWFSADGYYEISQNLLAGRGFSQAENAPYEPDSVRAPLYPLFIVGLFDFFHSYKALFIVQILIGCITVLLGYSVARELFGDDTRARAIGITLALEPLGAYLTGNILTETVFTCIFWLALWLTLKILKQPTIAGAAALGLLLGIATLVKPTIQFVPLFVVCLFWLFRKTDMRTCIITSALVLGLFYLMLAPWLYRNYLVFNNASLVVQPVSNLYAYLVPSTIALEKHIPFQQAQNEFMAEQHSRGIGDVTLANAAEYKQRALTELVKHPVGLIKSFGVTLYAFFTNDAYRNIVDRYSSVTNYAALAFIGLGRLFWISITLLAIWGAYRWWRRAGLTPHLVFIVGTIMYFACTSAVIGLAINGRFRLPVQVLLFILASVAIWGSKSDTEAASRVQ